MVCNGHCTRSNELVIATKRLVDGVTKIREQTGERHMNLNEGNLANVDMDVYG